MSCLVLPGLVSSPRVSSCLVAPRSRLVSLRLVSCLVSSHFVIAVVMIAARFGHREVVTLIVFVCYVLLDILYYYIVIISHYILIKLKNCY